jgi:hypothetical protein
MHITHADLRAYADLELPDGERAAADRHLAGCPDCRTRLQAVAEQTARVSARLAPLAPQSAEAPRPAGIVLAQIKQKKRKELFPMLKSMITKRPVWAGLAAVLVLAGAFSLAPVRAWAGEFLGLFRVQQVQVLPIDTSQLGALSNNSTLAKQLSQLFSDSVNVTRQPGQPVVATSAAQASQLANFNVRLMGSGQGDPRITVQSGTAFDVVINRARAQAVIDEAGRSDLQLPASIDGAKISVDIPAEASVAYGCPAGIGDAAVGPARLSADGQPSGCAVLIQVPSPTVNTPPDFNITPLAEIGLQLTGMPAAEAKQISQSVDWTSTLVIPFPRNAGNYQPVSVDGVSGTLIDRAADGTTVQHYTLIWVKNGIIYALNGTGTSDQALNLANSIQ